MFDRRLFLAATLALAFAHNTSAARFDVLFPVDDPYGDKSIHVSADGSLVLSSRTGAGHHDTYIWESSKGITQRFSRYEDAFRRGMSGDGKTILVTYVPSSVAAFDASFDGSVVVGVRSREKWGEAIRIADGQITGLGDLLGGQFGSTALAVSADGNTVVGRSYGEDWFQPFRWTPERGMEPLGKLPDSPSPRGYAQDVSADGSVIVGWAFSSNSSQEAFRWTATTGMQGLGDFPGGQFASEATAISADGTVIVGRGLTENRFEAFIWDESHGMRKLADVLKAQHGLDTEGLLLRNATGVSADGQIIVGWGEDAHGQTFAWRADLRTIPEPHSLFLVLWAGALIASYRIAVYQSA